MIRYYTIERKARLGHYINLIMEEGDKESIVKMIDYPDKIQSEIKFSGMRMVSSFDSDGFEIIECYGNKTQTKQLRKMLDEAYSGLR